MQQTSPNKFKTKRDCMEELIYRELWKRITFDHSIKWYMQNPESVLENVSHKIICVFKIHTDASVN